MHQPGGLTQDAELGLGADVLVPVGSRAAVAARVVVSNAPDDQVAAHQQRVLLVPAQRRKMASPEHPTHPQPPGSWVVLLSVSVWALTSSG